MENGTATKAEIRVVLNNGKATIIVKAENVPLEHNAIVIGSDSHTREYDTRIHNCDVICRTIQGDDDNPANNAPPSDEPGNFTINGSISHTSPQDDKSSGSDAGSSELSSEHSLPLL